MTIALIRAATIAAAALLSSSNAFALSFDERWKSLFADSEVAGDAVSAKAEMVRRIERPARAQRHRAYRHRAARGERRREWYKGGKKWRYVYARRRGR